MRFRMRHLIFALCMALVVHVPASVFAQAEGEAKTDTKASSKGGDKKGGKKSSTINFEDQLVEGQAQKPELFYLLQKKQFNYKRLIRLRDDFVPEMRKTSEDIQRKGSGT